jgi:hypothetical protein
MTRGVKNDGGKRYEGPRLPATGANVLTDEKIAEIEICLDCPFEDGCHPNWLSCPLVEQGLKGTGD